jgi:transposase
MSYTNFIGIDVSKATIDVALLNIHTQNLTRHDQFANSAEGIVRLFEWLHGFADFHQSEALFCMEATGLYCYPLVEGLQRRAVAIWIENAVQIKRSSGLVRGKNDQVDALRIARYAFKNQDNLRLWKPMREVVEKIRHLATLRDRIVQTQKRLLTPIEELRVSGQEAMARMLEKSIKTTTTALDKDLTKVEKEILSLIDKDDSLKRLYAIITSVVGIGFVTAVNLIIHTNEFTQVRDSRKLACYCGVAPFAHQSGSSIRGKTSVHPMANKKLKCNLHMASLVAVKLDADLKQYYHRKVAEGKNKMSVLNAVKCKLLARVVACVDKQKLYVKKTA